MSLKTLFNRHERQNMIHNEKCPRCPRCRGTIYNAVSGCHWCGPSKQLWRDPCVFGGAMVGSEPIIPVAPVDSYAHLRQAVRDGRRIRRARATWRWEDNGNWVFSCPVEDYEIEPLPVVMATIGPLSHHEMRLLSDSLGLFSGTCGFWDRFRNVQSRGKLCIQFVEMP